MYRYGVRPSACPSCLSVRSLLHRAMAYTQGDSDVISMPADFRRHLVGKTLINVFHCDIAEIGYASLVS